jgi:hypothetical protein
MANKREREHLGWVLGRWVLRIGEGRIEGWKWVRYISTVNFDVYGPEHTSSLTQELIVVYLLEQTDVPFGEKKKQTNK